MNTPDGRPISRDEALGHLSAERFRLQQDRLALVREITARQKAIDAIDERLRTIDQAEGYLR